MTKEEKAAAALKAEQQKNVDQLNAKSQDNAPPPADAPPTTPTPPTTAELLEIWLNADDAADAIKTKLRAGQATPDEFMAAKMTAFKAQNDYKKSDVADKAAEADKLAQAKMVEARAHICQVLGIDDAKLTELTVAPADGTPNIFVTSFHTVFGHKQIVAKQGETGKALTANASRSNGGSVSDAIKAEILAGATYEQLLQKYPTKNSDGTIDYKKLNGTARTVIGVNKFKKQADGTYQQ